MTKRDTRITGDPVVAANRDLYKQIEKRGVDVVYDDVLDTLFIEIGGPRKATNVHVDEDIMLRIDPTTMEVVAAEIPLYQKGFVRDRRTLANYIEELGVRDDRESDSVKPNVDPERVSQLLQDWITAFCRLELETWDRPLL